MLCSLFSLYLGVLSASGQDVVALLSANTGVYQETFNVFKTAYNGPVTAYDLSKETPQFDENVKFIVTFGGKAAGYSLPSAPAVIYCIAPGRSMDPTERQGRTWKISMTPEMHTVLSKITSLQPRLKKLAVLWSSPIYLERARELEYLAAKKGIKIVRYQLRTLDDLPRTLRAIKQSADAFWLFPDPNLISADSIEDMKDFSRRNKIPFYAGTKGLAKTAAAAAIGVSFAEIGKMAAEVIKLPPDMAPHSNTLLFPERAEFTINITAARESGLDLSPDIIKSADYIFE